MNKIKYCANEKMAIDILELIKRGCDKNFNVGGKQKYIEALEMSIEALEMGIEALKKQIPKKPVPFQRVAHDFETGICSYTHYECDNIKPYNHEYEYTDYKCPSCNKKVSDGIPDYCCHCGQALDWSDTT